MAAKAISKTYLEVFETEKELRAQFIAANEICQEAYNHLDGLKKRLNDKVCYYYYFFDRAYLW